VISDLPKFMSLDIASITSSLVKLHYIPRMILNEFNHQQNLSTFNKYSCLIILESLVQEGYDENHELYDKFFLQLNKSSANMNTKLVSRVINVILKYKEIVKGDKERSEQIHNLAQFYVDRFNDSVSKHEKQVETEIVLQSLDNIKQLQAL
jgi:hypothetical protein